MEKIHAIKLLKAIKKFEALPETVRKINDLKKASVGKIRKTESSVDIIQTSIEWPLLLDSINVEYCNTVTVSSRTLLISLSLSLSLSLLFSLSLSFEALSLKIRLPFDIRKTRMVRFQNF